MRKGISVIICCYNSKSRIRKTLEYLHRQKVSKTIEWEIILIDNASTDGTADFVSKTWDEFNSSFSFSIVKESTPGLSAARHKGIEVSKYSYLIFCDDDNWLHQDYVELAFEVLEKNPEIGIAGGVNFPEFEVLPPDWFYKYQRAYAVGRQGEIAGDITKSKAYVFGAGAVLRKSMLLKLKELGFGSLLSDRKGKDLTCGGDNEWGALAILLGYQIWFDERLKLHHYIPKDRLSWSYFLRLQEGVAKSKIALIPYKYYIQLNYSPSPITLWRSALIYALKDLFLILKSRIGKDGDVIDNEYRFLLTKTWVKTLLLNRRLFINNCKAILSLKSKVT